MSPIPIGNIPLFRNLNEDDLLELSQTLRLKVLKDGEILFNEGEPGDCFYIITQGELDVIKACGTPEERLLNVNGPGEFIGEMSLLNDNTPRTATVLARGETLLLELHRERFEEMIANRPSIAYHMVREVSDRLRSSDETTIADLRRKNQELAKAYHDLQAAQEELIKKEKLEAELDLARQIQISMLPQEIAVFNSCEIGAKMVPARAVGGDFYDVIPLADGNIGLAVGDVSDKGVAAAMFMAQFCTLLRVVAQQGNPPGETLTSVNNALLDSNLAGMFVTVIYGVFDPAKRKFCYARAGHEIPVIFDSNGGVKQPPHNKGTALCIFPDPPIDVQEVQMGAGSTLMMYTDGGTDALNTDERFFGLENLKETISSHLAKSPQELCDHVIDTLLAYQGEEQFDDATLVALRAL